MKEKLNEIGMKITELAEYLNLSRPTIYKMIEMYESKEKIKLKKQYFDLFEFIDENKFLTKTSLISYIIHKFNNNKEANILDLNNLPEEKRILIEEIVYSNKFDDLIETLINLNEEKILAIKGELKKWN